MSTRSRTLINCFVCVYYYVYPTQVYDAVVAKFVEQKRESCCIYNLPNIWLTTIQRSTIVYLSFHAHRGVIHWYTELFSSILTRSLKVAKFFPRSCIADELVFFARWKRGSADPSNNKRSRSYVIVRMTILELATNSLRTQKQRATHKRAADDCRLRSGLPMNNTFSFISSCFTRVSRDFVNQPWIIVILIRKKNKNLKINITNILYQKLKIDIT